MELLNDFNTTIRKAFDEIDPNWEKYEGLVICGTHTPKDWEEQIDKIKQARERDIPTLGICFGHQLMAVEFARNILRIEGATSEEFATEPPFVVVKRKDLKVGLHGGETYWNWYEVRDDILDAMIKWKRENPFNFYESVQYHPEYQSSKDNPHPLLVRFLKVCKS